MSHSGATETCGERVGGLRRFAIAITLLNIAGHMWLGFEQSFAQPVVALLAAYFTEFVLEWVEAVSMHRTPRYLGGWQRTIDFFLSAHITGLACSMLVYANERLWPIAFAAVVAIASKAIFRVPVGHKTIHFMNPSNFGIVITLLVFPWVGIAQPYQFTENLAGPGDWIMPAVVICTGTFLNTKFTRRMPLIAGWVLGFAAQAVIRHLWYGTPLAPKLVPMTGVVFVLYTFYMVTDPATTPSRPRFQFLFGAAVAFSYMVLVNFHIVFGFYFALAIVTSTRGLILFCSHVLASMPQRVAYSPRPDTLIRTVSELQPAEMHFSDIRQPSTAPTGLGQL